MSIIRRLPWRLRYKGNCRRWGLEASGDVVKEEGRWGQPLVQPLKLHILQVKVLLQELPIYLGSDIRLRRR